MNGILFEPLLGQFRVDFDYISQQSSSQFKVIPKVLLIDKSLDIAVLQLKRDEKKPFPPPLKMFHVLNTEKDGDKQIYLISHNKSKKKEVNSGIGIWKPTEKRLEDLEKFCQQYGEENGYIGLERKDRLVIQCDFVGGASGSPGIVILNNVAYVVLVYIRGFPSFYHNQQFSEEQKRTFPRDKLFQHGVNIGNLFANMSSGTYIVLRNEIFPEEALKFEQTINQHKLAISGDKTSSNKETTETSTGIAKGKMDNISEKSETKIPISKATACTDQSEDNIPESANYRRLMSHSSVPGQTFITSPQEDTDRYNITGNQSAQGITSPQEDTDRYNITGNQSAQDITSPQEDTDRYNITGNQSAQDITSPQEDTDRYNITGNQSAQDITSPQEDTDRYNITGNQSAQDITSPQEDTDRYNITGNQSAQDITSPQEDTDRYNITGNQSAQDITSPQEDTDRYNITGNQSAQDITSPQEDTDRYNITGNQSAQDITSPQEDTDRYNITGNQSAQDITSPQEDTDRYNITGNQSAQDIKTGESDKCTVQDQGNHSHSSTGNAAAENHNLHAKDGEMITLQRSPGRTRPVSAGQISIDEWIGNEWQDHRYKQLQDNNLLLLSKAIHPECVNSVAIHFNLNQMDVEVIQTGQQTDLCYQMLYKWKNKNGEEATLGKLIQNLFSSWISENKSVEKEVLISAISQVTMASNEETAP
ncbi:triple collagen helix repeat-containing, partial [Mytilus galloprovincialis]